MIDVHSQTQIAHSIAPNRTHSMRLASLKTEQRSSACMPNGWCPVIAIGSTVVRKSMRGLEVRRGKRKGSQSMHTQMSGGRVRSLHSGEGLPQFAFYCEPRDHSDEA